MADRKPRPENGRADRILPGVWRLRLPCPWPGVPHVNAWAVAHGERIVLFDTGIGGPQADGQLEFALRQAGFTLADVELLVCTHAHSDHYGAADVVVDAAGCELWMHPAWEHVRRAFERPEEAWDWRLEIAAQSGVPRKALDRYAAERRDQTPPMGRIVEPDRDLVPGVEVETDLGTWQVHETPGHAPSHVVLHQPDRRLMISGDHLLGRISLFFDYGHSPDPVAEFLGGLETCEGLGTDLCLAGHGRPFRSVPEKIAANRELVEGQLERVLEAIAERPKTAFEVVADLIGPENISEASAAWGLQMALSYLDHLELSGRVAATEQDGHKLWAPVD